MYLVPDSIVLSLQIGVALMREGHARSSRCNLFPEGLLIRLAMAQLLWHHMMITRGTMIAGDGSNSKISILGRPCGSKSSRTQSPDGHCVMICRFCMLRLKIVAGGLSAQVDWVVTESRKAGNK